MEQKLKAMTYIKNNKKRVATLIVSLTLAVVLNYLTAFMLGITEETFRTLCIDIPQKIQYVEPYMTMYGMNVEYETDEEWDALFAEFEVHNLELLERIKADDRVFRAYYTNLIFVKIAPPIGEWYFEVPLFEKEEIPTLMEYMGAKLVEGRLPENYGEIIIDRDVMNNNGYKIGDTVEDYSDMFQIVGVTEGNYYFTCGAINPEYTAYKQLVIFSEEIKDIPTFMKDMGIDEIGEDRYFDMGKGQESFQKDVTDTIEESTDIVYAGVVIVICISLLIVYTTYLRDRHQEWCLYHSIGYKRKTIFMAILRELGFTFVVSLVAGALITAISMVVVDAIMIAPYGLKCRYFDVDAILQILCNFAFFFATLLIPVRYALGRIKTVDAMEDDLY